MTWQLSEYTETLEKQTTFYEVQEWTILEIDYIETTYKLDM